MTRHIYVCDECGLSIFEDEDACVMCGSQQFTNSTMPPLAVEALYLVRAGYSMPEAFKIVMSALIKGVIKDGMQKILDESQY